MAKALTFDFDSDPLSIGGLFPATFAPLQVDIYGYCQMACFYCFSNLNKKASDREQNFKNSAPQFFRHVDRALGQEDSLIGHLLREKYYFAMSNTTDPFQREEKNHRVTEGVLSWAQSQEQPVFIETKGNVLLEEFDHYLPLLKPRVLVYLSLSTLNNRLARRLEPGAQSPEDRLELVRKLSSNGVPVVVAANPYVPEWIPDLDEYCETLYDAGARDVFPFFFHLTDKQAAQIPPAYAKEAGLANTPRTLQIAGFAKWKRACQQAKIRLGLATYLSPVFDYEHALSGSPTLFQTPPKGSWFGKFMEHVRDVSRVNGDVPVAFTWRHIEEHFRKQGVSNPLINTSPLDSAWNHSSEAHRNWKYHVGKEANLYTCLRYAYNTPWSRVDTVWSDSHVRCLYDFVHDVYDTSVENDKIGVWFPELRGRETRITQADLPNNVLKM